MAARDCGTCAKKVYPNEKLSIADEWFHRTCLKCFSCGVTLNLKSVYTSSLPPTAVALHPDSPLHAAPALQHQPQTLELKKRLYCAKHVPRQQHTSVVDSVTLRRALSAPKADKDGGKKGLVGNRMGSMRFKGLTLRSRTVKSAMEAPKTAAEGLKKTKVVVGTVRGADLSSLNIAHALEMTKQTSSPITSMPAITAQLTGLQANHFPSPSIPYSLHSPTEGSGIRFECTPNGAGEDGGLAREEKGEKERPEEVVEKNLVRKLMRAFNLGEVAELEIQPTGVRLPRSSAPDAPPPERIEEVELPSALAQLTLRDAAATGTLTVRTIASTAPSSGRPSLLGIFDPPKPAGAAADDELAPSVKEKTIRGDGRFRTSAARAARGTSALTALFAPGGAELVPLPDSPELGPTTFGDRGSEADVSELGEGEVEGEDEDGSDVGPEELAKLMESEGVEVTLLYEDEVEPEQIDEGDLAADADEEDNSTTASASTSGPSSTILPTPVAAPVALVASDSPVPVAA